MPVPVPSEHCTGSTHSVPQPSEDSVTRACISGIKPFRPGVALSYIINAVWELAGPTSLKVCQMCEIILCKPRRTGSMQSSKKPNNVTVTAMKVPVACLVKSDVGRWLGKCQIWEKLL